MQAIVKGVVWILFILGMASVMLPKAHAGTETELRELLDNKQIVYNGVCWFDKQGVLTFKAEEKRDVKRCVVGMELPDQTKHYVLLMDDKGAKELLVYDETTKKQTSLWRKGTEV